jgi:hypothetical protein
MKFNVRWLGRSSFVAASIYALVILGESSASWYNGPGAACVVALIGFAAAYFRTVRVIKRLAGHEDDTDRRLHR